MPIKKDFDGYTFVAFLDISGFKRLMEDGKYLFKWDNVPGNDEGRLRTFLVDDLDVGWAKNAKIRKSDDGECIDVFEGESSAKIIIDENKEKATIRISDDRLCDRQVKRENGKLKIYDENGAWDALDKFYRCGNETLRENNTWENNEHVDGIFVSDKEVLFVRDCRDKKMCLTSLLSVIQKINKKMLEYDRMLTTSIAYGHFKYEKRMESREVEKSAIYGLAYVAAFLANESAKRKIQPGQCRIVRKNLPPEIKEALEGNHSQDKILRLVKKKNGDNNNYYFYWMVETPSEIDDFEEKYIDADNSGYDGMLRALKMEKCPICTGSNLSDDFNVIGRHGIRVIVQGKIRAIDEDHHYPPFSDHFTVTLYPRKGRVKYLKFRTKNKLKEWGFIEGKRIRCEGCLHEVDGKEIVFDVTKVQFL